MEIEMFFAKYDTDGDGVFRLSSNSIPAFEFRSMHSLDVLLSAGRREHK